VQPTHKYGVHEIFGPTIQGEGQMAGVPCIFLRFSGCNMWDGRPETREESTCPFCDTDFFSHKMLTIEEILSQIRDLEGDNQIKWVWISGGEPSLQLDYNLLSSLQVKYDVAVESNGTREFKDDVYFNIDHLTISPKLPWEQTVIRRADTLKLLYPHPNPSINPHAFRDFNAESYYLQPIAHDDDDERTRGIGTQSVINKLYDLPGWKLSIQLHKVIGLP